MRSRIRVLHIVQNLNYGGMERLIAEIARRVDEGRFESHVMALQYLGRFADDVGATAQLHQGPRMSRWSLLHPTELAHRIAAIDPDVVHTHSGVWLKAGRAARLAGVRWIVHTEHGRQMPDPWTDRTIDGIAARNTDVVVAVSAPLARHLARHVLPRSHTLRVITNGVDTETFRPSRVGATVRGELGIAADRMVIGSVGRLEPIKGYDVAIQAYSLLRENWTVSAHPPVLVIAGDGSERERLLQLIAGRSWATDVKFIGWRDDIHALHRTFDLFTLPSRSEGTSVSLLEAMSAGLCPIVTDVGGNREVLGPELTDRLVPSERPSALAAAWYEALVDARERRLFDGARARQRVLDAFDVRAMVQKYEELYLQGQAGSHKARQAPYVLATP